MRWAIVIGIDGYGGKVSNLSAAVDDAARAFAPGLLPLRPTIPTGPSSGQWIRRGNTIVLIGLEPAPI